MITDASADGSDRAYNSSSASSRTASLSGNGSSTYASSNVSTASGSDGADDGSSLVAIGTSGLSSIGSRSPSICESETVMITSPAADAVTYHHHGKRRPLRFASA